MFPFQRGIVNSLWAGNFWALYAFMDRFLLQIYKIFGDIET